MARPIRVVHTGEYYFITNRCLLGQFLMRPDEECRRIFKGCLARAADELGVEGRRTYHAACGGGPDEPGEVLGFESATERDWRERADVPEASGTRRILGVSSDAEAIATYHDWRRELHRNYRRASKRAPDVPRDAFPPGTHPPGGRHCAGHPGAG